MGRHATTAAKVELEERRDRLQRRITAWNRRGAEFLAGEEELLSGDLESDSQWDSDTDGDDFGDHLIPICDAAAPEREILPLPSALIEGRDEHLSGQELLLRQGQANDALHAIQIKISYKAGLFRGAVRSANSQKARTRAWDEVNAAEAVVQQHAGVYSRARDAMINLGAGPELLLRYQPLLKAHLQATTSVMDPTVQRHRNEKLAWFWKMDAQGDMDSDLWMQECA